MKHVFSSPDIIAHLWASQQQEDARTPHNNFYFNGATIYSYGSHFPIAHHVTGKPNVVLFTTQGYSVTTSKHISIVRRAINYKTVVYCFKPKVSRAYTPEFWENVQHFYNSAIKSIEEANTDRKIRPATRANHRESAFNELESCVKFLEVFDVTPEMLKNIDVWGGKFKEDKKQFEAIKQLIIDRSTIIEGSDNNILADYKKMQEDAKKRAENKRKKELKERVKKAQERLKLWLEGESIEIYHLRELPEIYLRAIPRDEKTQVQTSWGAVVTTQEAKKLYLARKRGSDLLGYVIDGFTVIENKPDHITIGCHIIKQTEIERFAKVMGWE
jgi:hypothetical protein